MIFSGGIDNIIKGWDLRKLDVAMRLTGHTDTVTGLALSPDGDFLLSNAMDNTLRVWDVRPYAPAERCTKVSSRFTSLYIVLWSVCGLVSVHRISHQFYLLLVLLLLLSVISFT